MRCSDSFLVASILTFMTLETVAFVVVLPKVLPEQRRQPRLHQQQHQHHQQQQQQSNRLSSTVVVRHLASDRDAVDDGEDGDYDEYLRKSLERAKNDKLGAPIPPEVKRQRAKKVESEFLEAMQTVSEEFLRLKKELGSDGAVDRFLEQIDDENERIQDDDLESIFQ